MKFFNTLKIGNKIILKKININNIKQNLDSFYFYSKYKLDYKYLSELRVPQRKEDSYNYLKKIIDRSKKNRGHYWYITKDEKIVGTIGINDINSYRKSGLISYAFDKSSIYTTEIFLVIKNVIDDCFKKKIYRIEAITQINNKNNSKLLEYFGFQLEGVKKDFYRQLKNNKRIDASFYSLFKKNLFKNNHKSLILKSSKNKINKIILIGGNINSQDIPFKNILAVLDKLKLKIDIITTQKRLNFKSKSQKTFEHYLKKQKIEYSIFEKYSQAERFIIKNSDSRKTIIISLNCNWKFKDKMIKRFPYLFNYHNASLKKYRGAACQSWGLIMREKICELNIHKINKQLDDGDILLSKKINIKNLKTLNEIYNKISLYEKNFFKKFFYLFFSNNLTIKKSDSQNSYYYPKLNQKKDSFINWNWPIKDIESFTRAFDDPYIGASGKVSNKLYLLKKPKIEELKYTHSFQRGLIIRIVKKRIFVIVKDGIISFLCSNIENINLLGKRFKI